MRFQIVPGFVVFYLLMDMIKALLSNEEWQRFFEYKLAHAHMSQYEENELRNFVESCAYLPVARCLNAGGAFSVPKMKKVNKSSSDKKRLVFVFPDDEMMVQKMLAWQLLSLDDIFADNLYSFRKEMGVKKAVSRLLHTKEISAMYSYKLDVSDYFNSINADLLLPMLQEVLFEQKELLRIITDMLQNP